jgi:hypothetical protein
VIPAGPRMYQPWLGTGVLGPKVGQMIAGPYGQVSRAELEVAAKASGPTINVVTRLTSAPQAGRSLSVASGENAEKLANGARQGGSLFGASIPQALMSTMEKVGLMETRKVSMGGVDATEFRFAPQATEFVSRFFSEKK